MNSVNAKICSVILALGLIFDFSACSKKNDPGTATVGFSSVNATYAEDKGAVDIEVTLSAKQSQDVTVNYTWNSIDTTTFLGGDFSFITPTPITIKAGETAGNIQIQVIDDTQIDGDDNVTLTLTGTSTNATLSSVAANNTFALTITDNDSAPANELQVDLVWYIRGDRTADITAVNLDLALQDSVIIDNANHAIKNIGETYVSSNNTKGFETLFLKATNADSVYWIAAPYVTGTSSVSFIVTLNGFGWTPNVTNMPNFAFGTYAPTDLNTALFFGPFTKSGTNFTFTGRVVTSNSGNRKILKFKATEFGR